LWCKSSEPLGVGSGVGAEPENPGFPGDEEFGLASDGQIEQVVIVRMLRPCEDSRNIVHPLSIFQDGVKNLF